VYGIDYKAYRNSVQLFGMELAPTSPCTRSASATSAPGPAHGRNQRGADVRTQYNIPGGKHGAQADFDRVRAHAKAAYNTLRLSATSGRVLADDWQWRGLFNARSRPTRWCQASSSAPVAPPRCAVLTSAKWRTIPVPA
jgi:hypothetical protein